jgi:hypothetical protein
LRGAGVIEGQSEVDRQRFAERVLRQLHDEGLIYFFRVPPPYDINAAGEDSKLRLTPEEIDEALRGDCWRRSEGLPEHNPGVWFGPTPTGEAHARIRQRGSESCGDWTTGRKRLSRRSSSITGPTASRPPDASN